MKKSILAKKVVLYYQIYKAYLLDNNLDDDSNSITVPSLMYFVDQMINPEEFKRLSDGL